MNSREPVFVSSRATSESTAVDEAHLSAPAKKEGITARSVILGVFFAAFASLFLTYDEYVIRSSYLNLSHFPLIAFLCFLALVVLNAVLDRLGFVRPLSPFELLIILAMVMAGSVLPTWQLTGFWLAIISSPYYFATPENRWEPYFHNYISDWLAPSDQTGAMTWFFEGLPAGERIPWEVWVVPLFWWVCFIAAVTLVSACIVVALRRQWTHHEKLGYPLVSVGIEMATKSGAVGFRPEFMQGKLFWAGVAIPFGIVCWNILTYLVPGLPAIPLGGGNVVLYQGAPGINLNIHFFAMAFGFFANLEVLFSIWFFFLIFIVEASIFNRIGYSAGEGAYWSSYSAATGWQCWGAFWCMVFWVLWTARHHLKNIVRGAFGDASLAEDGDEMMSYRTVVFGFILGIVFILFWLHSAGMSYKMALVLTVSTLVIYIGVSRIVAETGLAYVRAPMTAQYSTLFVLGTETTSGATLTALTFTYSLVARGTGLFMPVLTQAGKVADVAARSRKGILVCTGLALFVSLLCSVWETLYLGYAHGAYNFNSWKINSAAPKVLNDVVVYMQSPFPTDWEKLQFFWIGAGVMAVMTFLRYRFSGWPIHPIGFAISSTYFSYRMTFSIFLAWAFKWIFIKIGDAALYRRSRPFFIGILVGWALGVALTIFVDAIWFPGSGHHIHAD